MSDVRWKWSETVPEHVEVQCEHMRTTPGFEPDGEWPGIWVTLPLNTATGWQITEREPLTITPSILIDCGCHGFITRGVWVPAG